MVLTLVIVILGFVVLLAVVDRLENRQEDPAQTIDGLDNVVPFRNEIIDRPKWSDVVKKDDECA